MDKFKSKVLKIALGGIAVFAFGILVGSLLSNGTISSIQGYLFNAAGEATSANATNANATNANATNANATNANATNANASSANASSTDNIMYLQNFYLDSSSAKVGDRVYVNIFTSGACNSGASIIFKNTTTGATFTATVNSMNNKPYIVVPNSAVATTYTVTDVLLIGVNSDGTTFTKQYSESGANYYDFTSTLAVTANTNNSDTAPVEKVTLKSISLASSSAKVSDKVYVNVTASEKLSSLKLMFTSNENKPLTVYVKDLTNNKPYFEIPSSTVGGTYTLTGATLSTTKSSIAYSKDGGNDTEQFAFNSTLEISDGTENTFIYNNEDITSDVITKMYNAGVGTEITVNADSHTLINEELFNAIKGKDKTLTINYKENQIVFNGRDITDSKTIDVAMSVGEIDRSSNLGKLVNDGVVIHFADNGDLPGKALVRIKATDEISTKLNNTVYVYFYNDGDDNFCVTELDVKKTSNGYYEFTIDHNSDYIMVNQKLADSLVVESDDGIVSFQKGNGIYLALIAVAVVVIIAVTIVVLVQKNKNKKNPEKTMAENKGKDLHKNV